MRERKRFNSLQRGRINARAEFRRQLALRTRLERQLFTNLRRLFKKWVKVQMFLYSRYGVYNPDAAAQTLKEDLYPMFTEHFKKIFLVIYSYNETVHYQEKQDAFVFGRNQDIDRLVALYFASRIQFFEGIAAAQALRISRIIEDGQYAGLNLENIANMVSKEVETVTRSRAATIARTETHGAASHANHKYYQQAQVDLGIAMEKRWLATGDDRTRPAHAAANGQRVGMDEDFIVDGVAMAHTGDPKGGAKNIINCRCNTLYHDVGDIIN